MSGLFPVFLNLRGRSCVVVGGGLVAARKVTSLLDAAASVRVVSPSLNERLAVMQSRGVIAWSPRTYASGDLEGAALALAATDNRTVNAAVIAEARARGIPVMSVDGNPDASASGAALARRGDLAVAISTGGRSPAFARRLRQRIEALLDEELALFELAAELRPGLADAPSGDTWQAALDGEIGALLARGERERARALLASRLGPLAVAAQSD